GVQLLLRSWVPAAATRGDEACPGSAGSPSACSSAQPPPQLLHGQWPIERRPRDDAAAIHGGGGLPRVHAREPPEGLPLSCREELRTTIAQAQCDSPARETFAIATAPRPSGG